MLTAFKSWVDQCILPLREAEIYCSPHQASQGDRARAAITKAVLSHGKHNSKFSVQVILGITLHTNTLPLLSSEWGGHMCPFIWHMFMEPLFCPRLCALLGIKR